MQCKAGDVLFFVYFSVFFVFLCLARADDDYDNSRDSNNRDAQCPPRGFSRRAAENVRTGGFSLDEYVSRPWHVQMQVPIVYQPVENLFCVRATYALLSESESRAEAETDTETGMDQGVFDDDIRISVVNECRRRSVEGPSCGTKNMPLCARTSSRAARKPDTEPQGRLQVGPCFLSSVFYGPYWVVAYGNGEWVVVSGGEPENQGEKTDNTCTTETERVNGSGLWIMTRKQVADKDIIQAAVNAAEKLGFDVAMLVPVAQKGCVYN